MRDAGFRMQGGWELGGWMIDIWYQIQDFWIPLQITFYLLVANTY